MSDAIKLAIEKMDFVQEIEALEQKAHRLGLHVTAHAINRAKNAYGWELAGDTVQAGKAALKE